VPIGFLSARCILYENLAFLEVGKGNFGKFSSAENKNLADKSVC